MEGKAHKLDARAVHVPVADGLARTVLRNEQAQREEQQRLKTRILAAAADHEAAPRQPPHAPLPPASSRAHPRLAAALPCACGTVSTRNLWVKTTRGAARNKER